MRFVFPEKRTFHIIAYSSGFGPDVEMEDVGNFRMILPAEFMQLTGDVLRLQQFIHRRLQIMKKIIICGRNKCGRK